MSEFMSNPFVSTVIILQSLFCTAVCLQYLSRLRKQNAQENSSSKMPSFSIGDSVSSFQGKTLDGQIFSIEKLVKAPIVFVFFSPECPHCRKDIPITDRIFRTISENEQIILAFVTYAENHEVLQWKMQLEQENGEPLFSPIILSKTGFFRLNPNGELPFFCHINHDGVLMAQNHLKSKDWKRLIHSLLGTSAVDLHRYL